MLVTFKTPYQPSSSKTHNRTSHCGTPAIPGSQHPDILQTKSMNKIKFGMDKEASTGARKPLVTALTEYFQKNWFQTDSDTSDTLENNSLDKLKKDLANTANKSSLSYSKKEEEKKSHLDNYIKNLYGEMPEKKEAANKWYYDLKDEISKLHREPAQKNFKDVLSKLSFHIDTACRNAFRAKFNSYPKRSSENSSPPETDSKKTELSSKPKTELPTTDDYGKWYSLSTALTVKNWNQMEKLLQEQNNGEEILELLPYKYRHMHTPEAKIAALFDSQFSELARTYYKTGYMYRMPTLCKVYLALRPKHEELDKLAQFMYRK